jgi:hypothetical protein
MDPMTVRRGLLYFGVFLVAAGGVTLLNAAGRLDPTVVGNLLAWWPIALIAIGVALVLRRTRAAIPAGIVAAAAPGLLLGGMAVAIPDLPTPCTDGLPAGTTPVTAEGSFGSAARVDLELSCGEMTVATGPGSAWLVDATGDDRRPAEITSTDNRLTVSSGGDNRTFGWRTAADSWQVTLPTDAQLDIDATVNAGRAGLDLSGARLGTFGLDVNAGEAQVDLTSATLGRLTVAVNAGAATIHLPAAGGFTADLEANAGALTVCVPETLGLRVTSEAALGSIDINGLTRSGDAWVTPGYETAQSRADLTVEASVGSVDINAEGVCK